MKKNKSIPLYEITKTLSSVAMGREAADVCIKNAKLINVCTAEIMDNIDVAISCGRIALVGDAKHCIGKNTKLIDADGLFISPGFMDGHVHIESSMLTVTEYSRAVIPRGTTAVFMDPHEITNVLGLDGMKYMMEDGKNTPLKAFVTTPSCVPAVPAVPGFEDSGSNITVEDVLKTMEWDMVVGLGEMMNYPGIINSQDDPHNIVSTALKHDKVVTGHFPVLDSNKELNAYITAGINSCHETTREEEILDKMRLGMYAMLREGSGWRDLSATSKAIIENDIDTRFSMLVSDDTHPHTLIEYGHLDHILRKAVSLGINPITAIQMLTINVAQCFRMDNELGSITSGKCADIVFLKNLKDFEVVRTMINGEVISENDSIIIDMKDYIYPKEAVHTMKIPSEIIEDDFKIKTNKKNISKCRVIEVFEKKAINRYSEYDMPVLNDEIIADLDQDIIKACVIERHKNTKSKALGLIKGFGIKRGAVASTVAHDAHNLMILGVNDKDMVLCGNVLREQGGGMVACLDGEVIGLMPLPIAGLMSQLNRFEANEKIKKLDESWKVLGCEMESPFMTMASLALACIPEIRITNKGLVDISKFEFVDLEV